MLILIVFSAVWESLGQEVLWARKLVCVMKYFVIITTAVFMMAGLLCVLCVVQYFVLSPQQCMMAGLLCVLCVTQYFVLSSQQCL